MKEEEIARNWNILHNIQNFDNSKILARKISYQIPHTMSTINLHFDGAVRGGLAIVGGVLQNTWGEVMSAYSKKLGQGTNNVFDTTTLLWGLKYVVELKFRKSIIEGDSNLIIESI